MGKYINKVANATDWHFGAQNNSERHNQDIIKFIKWFIAKAIKNKCEAIVMLGDWHEQRNAINGLTLDYSYHGAELLNEVGIPVFIIVGNHDAYLRHSIAIYTTRMFSAFKNITVINQPTEVENLGPKGSLICPWLFHHEYPLLLSYGHLPVIFGHFEFKGYVITADTIVKEDGPDALDYSKPKKIFSGHYHKRQHHEGTNVHYIGNIFATNFADANDNDRGMMIYDFDNDEVEYINYEDGPTFVKTSLTALLDDPSILKENATVKCLSDVDITLEEAANMKDTFMTKYKLRDFKLEEPTTEALQNTDMDLSGLEMESTDNIVCNLLGRIDEPKIDNNILINIYKDLKVKELKV